MNQQGNWESRVVDGRVEFCAANASGTFVRDEAGMLLDFHYNGENCCLCDAPFGFRTATKNWYVKHLRIPEGIAQIGQMDLFPEQPGKKRHLLFQDLAVVDKIELPSTLKTLGANVFSGCLIPEMTLPAGLRGIGAGALMCCYIHELRIPKGLPHPVCEQNGEDGLFVYGRQFKETIVDTLYVPRDYPYEHLMYETRINRVIYTD